MSCPGDVSGASPGPEPARSHNVEGPLLRRYHLPSVGGRYAPRFVCAATAGPTTWLAWHAYEPETQLDHVCAQPFESGDRGELYCLTAEPGINDRPSLAVAPDGTAHVLWVRDSRHLMHRAFDSAEGHWRGASELPGTRGWLRDVDVCCGAEGRVWSAAVCGAGNNDRLVLHACDDGNWRCVSDLSLAGFAARPSVVSDAEGRVVVALGQYLARHYRVLVLAWQAGTWQELFEVSADSADNLTPRLTLDSSGRVWLAWLHELVVERDGVINRASAARVAVERDGRWQAVPGPDGPDAVRLYRGLLPISRYLGYSGLRRNPHLVATRDGAVHLLYEVQRDEDLPWQNVWTGRLEAVSYRHGRFEPPRLWYDNGVCYGADTHALHPADAVAVFFKSTHRDQADDFVVRPMDPNQAPPTEPVSHAAWRRWQAYTPRTRVDDRAELELDGKTLRLYFGDLHNHSVLSPDAEGHPDELYHFARDVAKVDFAAITDNDFYPEKVLHASESAYQRQLVARLAEPGRFLPLCGFEWTFHRDPSEAYNHRAVVFLGHEDRVVRRVDPAGHTEAAMRRSFQTMDVFAHAHHGQYRLLDIPQESNVEITSGWMVNIEQSRTAHEQLDAGHRFGFIGGSDSHRMTPGLGGALAAVWATELSYDAITDALRSRRCYATMGNRAVVDFRLNGALMGSVVPCPDRRTFHIHVRACTPLRQVSIIRNGTTVCQWDGDGVVFEKVWVDDGASPDAAWYYLRVEDCTPYRDHPHNVCQAVGPLAWSSPIWAVGGAR